MHQHQIKDGNGRSVGYLRSNINGYPTCV